MHKVISCCVAFLHVLPAKYFLLTGSTIMQLLTLLAYIRGHYTVKMTNNVKNKVSIENAIST